MNQPARRSTDRNLKVMHHRSLKSSKLEITQLQEDLRRTREQLILTESQKRQVEKEAEEAKKQLSTLYAKLEDFHQEKLETAKYEDTRIQQIRKLSQERDRAWQSELEAVQNERALDLVELRVLKQEMARVQPTVEHLKIQLRESEQAKANAEVMVCETRDQLEITRNTLETLLSERSEMIGSFNSIASELEKSRARENSLKESVKKLQEHKLEAEELRLSLEETEVKYLEEQIRSSIVLQSTYEFMEKLRNESILQENDLHLEIKELKDEVMSKEREFRGILEENEMLKVEAIRREELDMKILETTRLTGDLSEAEEVKEVLEVELKRMKVQAEQWRKAAETAVALLTDAKNGRSTQILMNSPFSDNLDDDFPKLRNNKVIRRIGELWKKGQK